MSTSTLYRLVYISSGVDEFTLGALAALLDRSRAKNASLDVTGLLLYCDGTFLQLLEGPRDAVEGLYRTILDDPRHARCMVLEEGPAEARLFPDWRMGFRMFTATQIGNLEGFSDFLDAGSDLARTLTARPEKAARLLLRFRNLPGMVPSAE